jgi:hypothetical protein
VHHRPDTAAIDRAGRHAADWRPEPAFFLARLPMGHGGGAGIVRDDAGERVIVDLLRREPATIVLQPIPKDAYTIQPALTILAGQTGRRGVETFFRGDLPDSALWLESNHIGCVLWLRDDNHCRRTRSIG